MDELPPIVTLTLNPSVDVTYDVDTLVEDRKVHAVAYRYDPGGNGINVARALARLRVPAHACFVAAGEVGQLLRRLLRRQVENAHALWVDGETRINVTLEQQLPRAQYEVIGVGPRLDAAALQRMEKQVERLAGRGYAVLTGPCRRGWRPTPTRGWQQHWLRAACAWCSTCRATRCAGSYRCGRT